MQNTPRNGNSRHVIERLLCGVDPPERVGLFDNPWSDTVRAWATGQGYPTNGNGQPVDVVDHFGFDMVSVGGWFDIMPKRGCNDVLDESADWKIVRNGAGAVLKWWKDKSGTPEHVDFHMTTRAVWERDYRPHLLDVDRERTDINAIGQNLQRRRGQGLWTFYGHQFIWETMRCSMGDLCMYESLLLDPDWIHDFNRVYTDFYKRHYELIFDEAGLPDGIWIYEDLGYRNGLFCAPRVLEELIFPYYREMVDFFHRRNLPVVLHSCGNVTEALPLIVASGFDALNPMEVKAGCNVLEFAERAGDRLAFVGGLDARVLESGDRTRIRREVVGLIDGMKERGARFVFGSDHSLSTNVRYDDFRFALDVYREHMAY